MCFRPLHLQINRQHVQSVKITIQLEYAHQVPRIENCLSRSMYLNYLVSVMQAYETRCIDAHLASACIAQCHACQKMEDDLGANELSIIVDGLTWFHTVLQSEIETRESDENHLAVNWMLLTHCQDMLCKRHASGKNGGSGAGSALKDGAGSALKDGADSALKDGADSALKDGADSALKDGAGSALKDGAGSALKDGAETAQDPRS